jgi:hypothetical protein
MAADTFTDSTKTSSGGAGDVETSTTRPRPGEDEGRIVVSSEESRSRQALLGKPNCNSVRNQNSLIRSDVTDSRSRKNMSNIEEGEGEVGSTKGGEDPIATSVTKKNCCTSFCGFMDDHFLAFVIGSAAIGMGIGIGLSFWNPEDESVKATAILWIGLLGDLFIRALKCIVLPLVFVSIAISVMDMVSSRHIVSVFVLLGDINYIRDI